ncbi:Flp pilus assembly protein CpaB [Arthrobacter sp. CG_A4]|uniref:Flp pilus assembly protein CpaB n=1 Tax=Arthrobacter sp. CG_A4 TaxID=3071706 RepID=UPI002E0944DE|nr:pilus assembly protein CpaB [Arthrobacter sp. CG_A4]
MNSRAIAAVTAVVLAVAGSILLVSYTNGAEQRAFAGVQTSEVLIVSAAVPAGTPADVVLQSATRQAVPAKALPADAVSDPAAINGLVTTVDLVPGEQLLRTRFRDPATMQDPGTTAVPAGMQEVSILLAPQRAVGGLLKAGDTVGVFISLKTEVTRLTLHKVLVTAVQGAPAPAAEDSTSGASPGAASENLLVTLALTAANAEKVVYGQEFGTIWLSDEPSTAVEDGTRELTRDGIYK